MSDTKQEITPYNVADQIRESVREVMISAIPDEQLDAMIENEYKLFFEGPFRKIVEDELRSRFGGQLKTWLNENFVTEWDSTKQQNTSKLVAEAIEELTPIVQRAMVVDIVNQTTFEMQQRLQSGLHR